MKAKTLRGGALIALSAMFALTPNYSAAALSGEIDYGGNIDQINQQTTNNILVQAMNDGGYVIAGVTGECHGGGVVLGSVSDSDLFAASSFSDLNCYCGDYSEIPMNVRDDDSSVAFSEQPIVCGYVARYSVDGSKIWQQNLELTEYKSLEVPTGRWQSVDSGEYMYDYGYDVNATPVQLKETTAGIAMTTRSGDYFLFNVANGNITKSYSLARVNEYEGDCPEPDNSVGRNSTVAEYCHDGFERVDPYYYNINSNGTVTTIDRWNSKEILQTNDGENYQTVSEDPALAEDIFDGSRSTQDAIYVVECAYAGVGKLERGGDSTVNAAYDSSCDLVRYNENFSNRQVVDLGVEEGEKWILGASDNIVLVNVYDGYYDEETNVEHFTKEGIVAVKGTSVIAKKVVDGFDATWNNETYEYDNVPDEVAALDEVISGISGPSVMDAIETSEGIAIVTPGKAVIVDENFGIVKEVSLQNSTDEANYNDIAFLRDGSVVIAGADVINSDHYEVDGEQNGIHIHYASIVTPKADGTGAPANIDNPRTLDDAVVYGIGAIGLIGASLGLVKRFGRR